jgi:glycosyltransferase involved in cell wall biosynthesis
MARQGSPLFEAAADAGIQVEAAGLPPMFRSSRKLDLVHAHDAHAHTTSAFAARCPFVVSRRVAFPVKRSLASRWKYKRAARYLAVSQFVARELRQAGVDIEKIDVVPDGVPDLEPGLWDPRAPAVALASQDPQKGRDLVTAAAGLASIDVVFSNNIIAHLRRASMFVYITHSEGLGSAALIAMAMGIPVIASRVGGLAEVFEDRASGIYTENSVDEIASAMRRIVNEEIRIQPLIENARKLAETKYSVHQLINRTLASYERALNA